MRVVYLLLLFIFSTTLFSKQIDCNRAQQFALKWIQKVAHKRKKIVADVTNQATSRSIKVLSASKKPYYIFNLEGGGWIIVADDDINSPVLAYSDRSSLNPKNLPPQFKWWLDNVSKELESAKKIQKASADLTKTTKSVEIDKAYSTIPAQESIGPLLKTSWGQGKGYNEYCPKDSQSIEGNGHVPAGCIAVAMAQIMNYYAWPPQGYGKNSYVPKSNPKYGVQSVDFGDTTYTWKSSEAAKITYHAGVSVNMDYGPYASGAYLTQAEYALKMNFRYKTSSVTKKYSDEQWDSKLIDSLNHNRLVLYQGKGDIVHAFVCDGYKKVDDGYMYHFNWGWNGIGDGWFKISQMTPFGSSNFNQSNYAIFDIYPSDPAYNLDIKQQSASLDFVMFLMLFVFAFFGYRGLRA